MLGLYWDYYFLTLHGSLQSFSKLPSPIQEALIMLHKFLADTASTKAVSVIQFYGLEYQRLVCSYLYAHFSY